MSQSPVSAPNSLGNPHCSLLVPPLLPHSILVVPPKSVIGLLLSLLTLPRSFYSSPRIQLLFICGQQIIISNPDLSLEWQIIYLIVPGFLPLDITQIPHIHWHQTGTHYFPFNSLPHASAPQHTISINSTPKQPSVQARNLEVMFESSIFFTYFYFVLCNQSWSSFNSRAYIFPKSVSSQSSLQWLRSKLLSVFTSSYYNSLQSPCFQSCSSSISYPYCSRKEWFSVNMVIFFFLKLLVYCP